MGAELINDNSVQADGEMIAMVVEALQKSGLKKFQISIGQVEYFKGLCAKAGLDEETELELREYISGKNIFGAEALLAEKQIHPSDSERLLKITDCYGSVEVLAFAKEAADNERSVQAIERLEKLYHVLCEYGVEKYVSFDLGMLSKYNYYTGVIFKAFTYGVGDAIVKGGRYDKLLAYFGKEAPAIGFMVVIDDLLLALEHQSAAPCAGEDIQIITYAEGDYENKLSKAKELRQSGVKVVLLPERGNV